MEEEEQLMASLLAWANAPDYLYRPDADMVKHR